MKQLAALHVEVSLTSDWARGGALGLVQSVHTGSKHAMPCPLLLMCVKPGAQDTSLFSPYYVIIQQLT